MGTQTQEQTAIEQLDATRSVFWPRGWVIGAVPPALAWALVSSGQALLVDVRTAEERKFVGHVPGSIHVPWATGTNLTPTRALYGSWKPKFPKMPTCCCCAAAASARCWPPSKPPRRV